MPTKIPKNLTYQPSPTLTKGLRPQKAAEYIGGISLSTLYRLEQAGKIKPRIHVSKRCTVYLIENLDEYLHSLEAAR